MINPSPLLRRNPGHRCRLQRRLGAVAGCRRLARRAAAWPARRAAARSGLFWLSMPRWLDGSAAAQP